MLTGKNYKFWFCTGSQDLYGDECLSRQGASLVYWRVLEQPQHHLGIVR